VNNHSNDHDFCEAFLRNVDGDYQYLIRGKNGEPKRGVLIDFDFNHAFYYTTRTKVLKTDKDGIVHLGRLKNIVSVSHQHLIINSSMQGLVRAASSGRSRRLGSFPRMCTSHIQMANP
jgi:hypothetical protein